MWNKYSVNGVRCVMAALFLMSCAPLYASMTEEQEERLTATLVRLGASPMTEESRELCDHVMRDDLEIRDRLSVFETFFSEQTFTQYHGQNLEAHVNYATADKTRMARFAGAFAAGAVRAAWRRADTDGAVSPLPLLLLESLYSGGNREMREAVGKGIGDVFRDNPLQQLKPLLIMDSPYPRTLVLEAMQTCVSLGVYARETEISAWLELPDTMATMFESAQVWLFDGGVLGPEHLASLESLFGAVPGDLHGIVALHLPDMTGFSAGTTPLRLPGSAIDMPALEMDVMRDTSAYFPVEGVMPLPEFTAAVLERFAAAAQATQFTQRPDLQRRAHVFLTHMLNRVDPAFVSLFPPGLGLNTPEACMAYLGFMWLVNSQLLLEAALMQAEVNIRIPLMALLVTADLFSDGGDSTLLFRTGPTGILFGQGAALRRARLTPELAYVNGIAVSGQLWQYDLSDMAGPLFTR